MAYDREQTRLRCLLIEEKEDLYFRGLRLEHLTRTQPDWEEQTAWVRMHGRWKTPKLHLGEIKESGGS